MMVIKVKKPWNTTGNGVRNSFNVFPENFALPVSSLATFKFSFFLTNSY